MLNITITQADMLAGVINSQTSDPIALAAQRAGLTQVKVGLHRMSFAHGNQLFSVEMPADLKQFRRDLTYGDRHEALRHGKVKGKFTEHIARTFGLKVQFAAKVSDIKVAA